MSTALLTEEQFKAVLPKKLKTGISKEVMDTVNNVLSDPLMAETLRDNILGYTEVLRDGKYKITDYLCAVKYVSYRMMGNKVTDAYIKTFPDRYTRLLNEGADSKTISSFASAYNRNKLVNTIYEQSMIPVHVLNQDHFQRALQVQAELMMGAKSEMVRQTAADSILKHLKPPESTKIDLTVHNEGQKDLMDELRETTAQLAKTQQQLISEGKMSAAEVAGQRIQVSEEDIEDGEIIENGSSS
tara:strand:- start:4805 stop:5533 length:729 start_codon:yes stop_codon:yes gene_type:complete